MPGTDNLSEKDKIEHYAKILFKRHCKDDADRLWEQQPEQVKQEYRRKGKTLAQSQSVLR